MILRTLITILAFAFTSPSWSAPNCPKKIEMTLFAEEVDLKIPEVIIVRANEIEQINDNRIAIQMLKNLGRLVIYTENKSFPIKLAIDISNIETCPFLTEINVKGMLKKDLGKFHFLTWNGTHYGKAHSVFAAYVPVIVRRSPTGF